MNFQNIAATNAMRVLDDNLWPMEQVKHVEWFAVPLVSVTDPVLRDAEEQAFAGKRSMIAFEQL